MNLKPGSSCPSIAILSHDDDCSRLPPTPLPSLSPNTLFTSALAHTNISCLLSLTSCRLTLPNNVLVPRPTFPYCIPYHSHKITHSAAGRGPITSYIIGKKKIIHHSGPGIGGHQSNSICWTCSCLFQPSLHHSPLQIPADSLGHFTSYQIHALRIVNSSQGE